MTRYSSVYVRCLGRAVTFSRCGWCGRFLTPSDTTCFESFGIRCQQEEDWYYEQYMQAEELRQENNRRQWQEYFEQERREQEALLARRKNR